MSLDWNESFPPLNLWNWSQFYAWEAQLDLNPVEGPEMVSIGERVDEWTAR